MTRSPGFPTARSMLDRAEPHGRARRTPVGNARRARCSSTSTGSRTSTRSSARQPAISCSKIVAERLEGVVRDGDTVGRLGGDEFVVLVESAARGVRLDALARRVIEALHKPVELDGFGPSFFLTASIGVAFGRYATPDDLLRDAQLALESAKAAGQGPLHAVQRQHALGHRGPRDAGGRARTRALQENQFFLLYQPIYDLRTQQGGGARGAHPLAAPDPGRAAAGRLHPAGRGNRPDRPDRSLGRRGGVLCGPRRWNVAGTPVGVSVKRLAPSAESRRLPHRRAPRTAAVGDRAVDADARDRRDDDDARPRRRRRAPRGGQAAGRADRDRRLRQRLRLPRGARAYAPRLPEGGPQLARGLRRRGLPQLAARGDPDRSAATCR